MTKHRQQSTKVKAKGTDLIWSQICSSLLHIYHIHCGLVGSHLPFPGLHNLNVEMRNLNNMVSKRPSSFNIFCF